MLPEMSELGTRRIHAQMVRFKLECDLVAVYLYVGARCVNLRNSEYRAT